MDTSNLYINDFFNKLCRQRYDVHGTDLAQESLNALNNQENIIIFPEDSSHGYFDDLSKFFPGFITLAKLYLKQGNDSYIQVMYYAKKYRTFIVDKSIKFSQLLDQHLSSEDLAKEMCDKANDLHEKYEEYIEFKHKKQKKVK